MLCSEFVSPSQIPPLYPTCTLPNMDYDPFCLYRSTYWFLFVKCVNYYLRSLTKVSSDF